MRVARRVREAARRNGSIERRDRASGRLHHPQDLMDAATADSASGQDPADRPHCLTQHSLQDPELTGMTRQQFTELIDALAPALEVQRERVLRTRRGHERLVASGTGAKAKLTPADRILATVLHLRKLATMDLLGQLFGVTAMTISRAKQEVHPLLEAHGHHINTSTARLRTPADVATFLAPDPNQTKVKKTSSRSARPKVDAKHPRTNQYRLSLGRSWML